MHGLLKIALSVCLLGAGGCYYAVLETGRPRSGQVIERPWQPALVGGLLHAPFAEIAERCPDGAARVEARQTTGNLLAMWGTLGIYAPLHVTVACANGGDATRAPAALTPRLESRRSTR